MSSSLREAVAPRPAITLVPYRNQHWYRVEGFESPYRGGLWPSVTTVLAGSVPKPALVPWARNVALADVREVLLTKGRDGITLFADRWEYEAWVEEVIAAARRRPDQVKEEAADYGSLAHRWIAEYVTKGREPAPGSEEAQVTPTLEGFKAWQEQAGLEIALSEFPVFSPSHGFAGTVDALARRPGSREYVVIDFKTSNGIYPEYALQVAAYSFAVEEWLGLPVSEAWVLRLPKAAPEEGRPAFQARRVEYWQEAFEVFKGCLRFWRWHRGPVWMEDGP